MKTFHRHAAMLLYEKGNAISERHSSWRCVCLNFARAEQHSRALRAFIADRIVALLADVEGFIYLCDDGDIFILFQGVLKPVAERLGSHFEDFNLALPGRPLADNPFHIFDLSHPYDWHVFSLRCNAKHKMLSESATISAAFAEGVR